MKRYSAVLALLLVVQPVMAEETVDAEKTLKDTVNSVLAILRSKDLNKKEKRDKVEEVINPVFDFHLMAKLSLGRKHWPRLSDDERLLLIPPGV